MDECLWFESEFIECSNNIEWWCKNGQLQVAARCQGCYYFNIMKVVVNFFQMIFSSLYWGTLAKQFWFQILSEFDPVFFPPTTGDAHILRITRITINLWETCPTFTIQSNIHRAAVTCSFLHFTSRKSMSHKWTGMKWSVHGSNWTQLYVLL